MLVVQVVHASRLIHVSWLDMQVYIFPGSDLTLIITYTLRSFSSSTCKSQVLLAQLNRSHDTLAGPPKLFLVSLQTLRKYDVP